MGGSESLCFILFCFCAGNKNYKEITLQLKKKKYCKTEVDGRRSNEWNIDFIK